jgi:hypothetical protein
MLLQVVGYQLWTQLGSGPTVKNDPVDHFREGPGCRVASTP